MALRAKDKSRESPFLLTNDISIFAPEWHQFLSSFSHAGSNDFNAPTMSLFWEMKMKLLRKNKESNPKATAVELLIARFPSINANIVYFLLVWFVLLKIQFIIPALSFLIEVIKKLAINRNEKNASIDALRSLRIKFPMIKASMPIELTT